MDGMISFAPETADMLRTHGVDPARVVDAHQEVIIHSMWRTPGEFPAGGTYESDVPRGVNHERVALREETTTELVIIGQHPDGRTLPPTSDSAEMCRLTIRDEGRWKFLDTPE